MTLLGLVAIVLGLCEPTQTEGAHRSTARTIAAEACCGTGAALPPQYVP